MEVWFYSRIGTEAARPTHALKQQEDLHPRSSQARQESFCPLDKDLSWKSANRPCGYRDLLVREPRQQAGVIIPGVKPTDGALVFNPAPETVIRANDTLIVIGADSHLKRLKSLANATTG